jgi:hypothetical protein
VLNIAFGEKAMSRIQIFEILKFKNEMTTTVDAEHLHSYIQSKMMKCDTSMRTHV